MIFPLPFRHDVAYPRLTELASMEVMLIVLGLGGIMLVCVIGLVALLLCGQEEGVDNL